MRELKFRAWNNNTNKYEYTELDYYFVIDQRIKAYAYEQYTGLKDKNGKEIYEGDIILMEKLLWSKIYSGFFFTFKIFLEDNSLIDFVR